MKAKTYNLKEKNKNTQQYYSDVNHFTDIVIEKLKKEIDLFIVTYLKYLNVNNKKMKKDKRNYYLEFLTLSILFNTYRNEIKKGNKSFEKVLKLLNIYRNKISILKLFIDPIKGILLGLNLKIKTIEYTNELERLSDWLEMTGEYEQKVKRIKKLILFYNSLSLNDKKLFLNKMDNIFNWFEKQSVKFIGDYTVNVGNYLKKDILNKKYKEDFIFCSKKRVEYHLNMVGAEILNRVYKNQFDRNKNKVLLLPGCMSINKNNCQAENYTFGKRCIYCNNKCNINKIKKIGQYNNFEVIIINHTTSLKNKKKIKKIFGNNVSVIGVACVLHLISGGWKLEDSNIPAQCVLLNYSGCKKHWTDKDIPTEIDLKKLLEIINNNNEIEKISI